MGVMATYCQVCGLPVQHDHYVPLENMLGIYRGAPSDDLKPRVSFGPEHQWLLDAVGLRLSPEQQPALIAGAVHDGAFEVDAADTLVMSGIDERAALHRVCHELAGKPDVWSPAGPMPEDERLLPYQQQLFEFEAFVADGLGWMLADPRTSPESGERIRERIDYYAGRRRVPGLMDLLRFAVEQRARLELHPNARPIFRRGAEELDHAFGALSARRCEGFLFAGLTDAQRNAFCDTGAVQVELRIKGLGALAVELHVEGEDAAGSFAPIEVAKA